MDILGPLTIAGVKKLRATGHALVAYPRKGIIVVDGFKRYSATAAVLAVVSKTKTNPVPLSKTAKVERAIDLFRRFRGEEPEFLDKVKIPRHDVAMVIGECDGVLYTTRRDGQQEKYIHKFAGKSRPLLASSFDGKQLYLIGGSYNFTEEGIVDAF